MSAQFAFCTAIRLGIREVMYDDATQELYVSERFGSGFQLI